MVIYSIYKATNKITGKCYIGFACNFTERKRTHKKRYKTTKTKFYDAIKSYGWDNFDWEVIYQSLDSNHCLTVMEPYFISELNSIENGYNMTFGGEGTLGHSMKGKIKHTDQTKALLSELKTGIKQSTETKQKISKKLKGRPASENLKQVMRDNNPSMHHIKAICPHCGKTGSHVIMKRWHFDRCKNA